MVQAVIFTLCLVSSIVLSVHTASTSTSSILDAVQSLDTTATHEPAMEEARNTDVSQSGASSDVMALPDDVIIDALFSNIDTVQDQIELCEEGLRQQLNSLKRGAHMQIETYNAADVSHGDRDHEDDDEDDVNGDNAEEEENDSLEIKDNDDGEEDDDVIDDDDEEDDDDDDDENDDDKMMPEQVRRRRSSPPLATPEVNSAAAHKVKSLAQSVVTRLSNRLDYLKKSLIQCYLMHRHME